MAVEGKNWMRQYLPTKHRVDRGNNWVAVNVTDGVSTMWCAYLFALIALVSFPATLVEAGFIPRSAFPSWVVSRGLITLIAWIAQTFIQLVLLSVIMVGQKVQARQGEDVRQRLAILDRLDAETPGGIADVLNQIQEHLKTQDVRLGELANKD